MGAAAQDLEVQFTWERCPQVGEYGLGMGPAVQYAVWASRNGNQEELVDTTTDTLYTMAVEPGTDVRVRVQGIDDQGTSSVKSDWSDPLYFESVGVGVPRPAYLKPNYPNPFNPETTLRYLVPEDLTPGTPLSLDVYNVRGQHVRRLPVERVPGLHNVRWDGRNAQGEPASSGLYLARLVVGTMVETGKMTLTK